jgi:glucose-1-phosphate thymidylyltransferase
MRAFILAGGFATRLWPLTEARAKPLLPLAGKPLLTHIIENIPMDIPITVSTNEAFGESFMEWKKTIDRSTITIRIEHTNSDDEKLGTLGATAQWITEENISDDILLLTGDNYFGFAMKDFIASYRSDTALVAGYDINDLEKATAFGTIILNEDQKTIAAFEEKPIEPKSTLVSTGCSILPKSVIPDLIAYAKIKPDNVGGIFEELLRLKKTVDCFSFENLWFDIGSFDAYVDATKALVGDEVILGKDAVMNETTREGSVVLGDKTVVTGSTLRDTVLFDGCIVDNCVLDHCVIDTDCELRNVDVTGKMIRSRTQLIGQEH